MLDKIFKKNLNQELSEQKLEIMAGVTQENTQFFAQPTNSSIDGISTSLAFKSMKMVTSAF